ncbi:uncharacterized protein LOC144452604 [Glandiceps talaboti]
MLNRFFLKFLCIKKRRNVTRGVESKRDANELVKLQVNASDFNERHGHCSDAVKMEDMLQKLPSEREPQTKPETLKDESDWQLLATVFDRICLIFYIVAYSVVIGVILPQIIFADSH